MCKPMVAAVTISSSYQSCIVAVSNHGLSLGSSSRALWSWSWSCKNVPAYPPTADDCGNVGICRSRCRDATLCQSVASEARDCIRRLRILRRTRRDVESLPLLWSFRGVQRTKLCRKSQYIVQWMYFSTAINISVIWNHNSFRGAVNLIKLLLYILFEKYIHILALETASSGNQHCANSTGTLSFPIGEHHWGDPTWHDAVYLNVRTTECRQR